MINRNKKNTIDAIDYLVEDVNDELYMKSLAKGAHKLRGIWKNGFKKTNDNKVQTHIRDAFIIAEKQQKLKLNKQK